MTELSDRNPISEFLALTFPAGSVFRTTRKMSPTGDSEKEHEESYDFGFDLSGCTIAKVVTEAAVSGLVIKVQSRMRPKQKHFPGGKYDFDMVSEFKKSRGAMMDPAVGAVKHLNKMDPAGRADLLRKMLAEAEAELEAKS